MSGLSIWQLLLLFTLYQSGDLQPGAVLTMSAGTSGPEILNVAVENDGWIKLDEGVWFKFADPDILFRVKGEERTMVNYKANLNIHVEEGVVKWTIPPGMASAFEIDDVQDVPGPIQFVRERDELVVQYPDQNESVMRFKIKQN